MTPTRSTVTGGARILLGAVAAALVAAGVGVLAAAEWPVLNRTPVSIETEPTGTTAAVACPGPLLAAGRDEQDASAVSIAAEPAVVGSGERSDVSGAVVFLAEGLAVAGAQSGSVASEDLTGFAASTCTTPRFESWLVGGATTTGSADLIVLTNPSDVAATVDLQVYGSQEATASAASGSGLVVGAHRRLIVPLAGLALGEPSPVIRVVSQAAPITAALQVSLTQTLDPVGLDVTGGAADPAPAQVIPGVVVPQEIAPGSAAVTVRVLAPSEATTATVTLVPVTGGAGQTTTVDLVAGSPVDASFSQAPAGRYVVRVDAGAPVVAGATTAVGGARDLAWFAAAAPTGTTSLAVAEGPDATLVLDAADSADAVSVLLRAENGTQSTATVPAGGVAEMRIPAAGVYTVEVTGGSLRAAVAYGGPGALGGYTVQPSPADAASIRVYP